MLICTPLSSPLAPPPAAHAPTIGGWSPSHPRTLAFCHPRPLPPLPSRTLVLSHPRPVSPSPSLALADSSVMTWSEDEQLREWGRSQLLRLCDTAGRWQQSLFEGARFELFGRVMWSPSSSPPHSKVDEFVPQPPWGCLCRGPHAEIGARRCMLTSEGTTAQEKCRVSMC